MQCFFFDDDGVDAFEPQEFVFPCIRVFVDVTYLVDGPDGMNAGGAEFADHIGGQGDYQVVVGSFLVEPGEVLVMVDGPGVLFYDNFVLQDFREHFDLFFGRKVPGHPEDVLHNISQPTNQMAEVVVPNRIRYFPSLNKISSRVVIPLM
jgi:hypothetical protein